tara:strand:- start:196 stop:549 length:354 start_codon:yes stop_codon:yes gene_type:complete
VITLIITLILSVTINVFFVFYLRWLLKKLVFLSENIGDLLKTMEGFSGHLESVHELETYYGDPTLKNLIVHSKQIVKDIEMYRDIYTLFHDENDIDLEKIFEREEVYDGEVHETEES